MALMKDKQPTKYDGEKKVWQCIKDNLPEEIICYFNREVNGREFDFCLLTENFGFMIIEVKGWDKSHIERVKSPDEIIMSDGSVQSSPKKQARSYSFDLIGIMNDEYKINPPIINMVCYPFLSETDYKNCGLEVVSEPEYTLFKEDIETSSVFSRKILEGYRKFRNSKYDKMIGNVYDTARRHFEPDYIASRPFESDHTAEPSVQSVNPYSCLAVYSNGMSRGDIDDAISYYFKGVKQIVFTKNQDDLEEIAKRLSEEFARKRLVVRNGNFALNAVDEKICINVKGGRFSVFNFEAVYIDGDTEISSFKVYNGALSEEQEEILSKIAEVTKFNINQFHIEHAETGRDVKVIAGAGTGKTYSMVSRIAFLCSSASNSDVTEPSDEIAMLTFTDDAANNMKTRLKQLFMNYFLLTNNTHYLEMVSNIEKMRISTIHGFAREIMSNNAAVLGVGTDFTNAVGTYEKRKIFERLFSDYLTEKNRTDPSFVYKLPIKIFSFKNLVSEIGKKLLEKGCDIKTLDMDLWGTPPTEMPYLNEIIEKVVVETEREYSVMLKNRNSVALSEYMVNLKKCIDSDSFNVNFYNYKYVFIDEFQDTDDAQIASFIALREKLGFNFFIVGDLKQSIYGFRGATMSAFDKMCRDSENWLTFTLNINYRSDKRLLSKFETVFAGFITNDDQNNREVLEGVKTNSIDENELVNAVEYTKEDKYDRLFDVIEQQKRRIEAEMETREMSKNERTIALLLRTNSDITKILNEAKSRNVAIESDNSGDLFGLAPSTDLCRLTSALCNPYDPAYLFDLISSRYVNVKFDIRSILGKSEEEKTEIFIECLDKFFTQCKRLNKTWKKLVYEIQNEPVLKTLRNIYEATQPWKAYSGEIQKREYYRANYDLVFEELSKRNQSGSLTINSINKTLHILILTGSSVRSRDIDTDSGSVRIICTTVHKSKGLEYGTVILPVTDTAINKRPQRGVEVSYDKINDEEKVGYCFYWYGDRYSSDLYDTEVEDEKLKRENSRLLYVAMTRAIDNFIWFTTPPENEDENNWDIMLNVLKE